MKIIFSFIVLLLCVYLNSNAQGYPETYFEANYGLLEYGFCIPEDYDSLKSYPLVMFLHGMGNNFSVYLDWYDSEFQMQNPCFVYTPKTPTSWADWSGWNYQLTEPMQATIHVLDSMISVYSIDEKRLYVYGISMGGEGVFDLLDKLPGKFAAAMSVCGGGRAWWAENISHTPFWMFHGDQDNVNPPSLTGQVYDELVRIGAKKMRYKKYPGYGHNIWDVAASEPSWHDWMFAHSLNDTSCSEPKTPIKLTGNLNGNNKIKLSWNDIRNPEERENKIWYYKIFNKDSLIGTVEYDNTVYEFPVINQVDTFSVSAVNYHFKESNKSNTVSYNNGTFTTRIETIQPEKISVTNLEQNFANPFNPSTIIKYYLDKPTQVKLSIYNLTGQCVRVLTDEFQDAGEYNLVWDSTDWNDNQVSSGIYFYRLETNEKVLTKKMVLLR